MPSVPRVAMLLVALGAAWCDASHTETTSAPPVRASRIVLQPCGVPGGSGEGRCGTYEVYENRTTKVGRKIGLNILVVPALGKRSAEPIFWFEGGPGGAATQSAGPVAQNYLRGLRADHDIVFVDQRGTGGSHPLECDDIGENPANLDAFFGKLFPTNLIRACRQKLEGIADLTQYSTIVAMDDLDEVRDALGYAKINLAGASYGTTAALVFLRQHPDHVRAVFLVGVAPPGFKLPLPFARAAQNAFDKLVSDCAANPACHTAFPKLPEEFAAVISRFDRGPIVVKMVDPATQQPRSVTLERESFVEHLRVMLYSTFGARFVPALIHQAYLKNFLPFQTMAARFNIGGGLARGMYFSVTCSEDIPFITNAEIAAETQATFLGERRVRAHIAACGEWPNADVPASFIDPVKTDVPVILFSGDADGSTPPWIAEAAVHFLANGRQITAPHTGHQIDGPCTWDLMEAFFRTPVAGQLDASCVQQAHRPAFVTDLTR